MAGFQTILEIHQKVTVNNRRIIGQQVTRSGQIAVSQYLTSVPWVFTVEPHNYLYYPQVRQLIQTIDNLDRQTPQVINFSSANLSWFTSYQGDFPSTVGACTLASVPPSNSQVLTIGNLPTGSSTALLFKAGDFIQVGGFTYKITADVPLGSSLTVSVPINRPVIGTPSTGTLTAVGSGVSFNVIAEQCPIYTLNPMTDGAFVEWSGPFVFREYITA